MKGGVYAQMNPFGPLKGGDEEPEVKPHVYGLAIKRKSPAKLLKAELLASGIDPHILRQLRLKREDL